MYGRPPSSRPGPPAPFVPASQQQRGARAIPIIAPSNDASPETKAAFAKQLAATSGSGGNVNGTAISATSPAKGALSAKAASAAVFIPKGISTPSTTNATPATFSNSTSENAYDDQQANNNAMMHDMNLNGPQEQQHFIHHQSPAIQNNLFLGNESGRGTPNSFGVGGGYDTDGSNSMFDPTYMGPLPNQQNSQEVQGTGNTNMNSGAASVQPQGGKAYNPYEHLNEYGEPTNGGALMPGAGQMGLDYYGTSGQHGNASASVKLRQPLQYHLYNPPMPHVSNLHPQHLSANAFFMSDEEREELQRKNEALHAGVPPPELGGPKLPEELHVYHSLVPLEHGQIAGMQGSSLVPQLINPRLVSPTAPQTVYQLTGATGEASRVFGYRCHVYKAQCTLDGKYYVLRRLENFRLSHEAAIGLVERWRRIRHPSIVSVREAFTTRAFGDSCKWIL
jgi:PAB-dependent poly(A)-specific ribonuclease subunit 3